MNEFLKMMEHMRYRHGVSEVFKDFLSLMKNVITVPNDQQLYDRLLEKYSKDDMESMQAMLRIATTEISSGIVKHGWFDFFGTIYEEIVGRYKAQGMGQFFTPPDLCNMMAQIQKAPTDEQIAQGITILEPTCGSGRTLMAFHNLFMVPRIEKREATNSTAIYTAIDLDGMCADMAAINLAIHGMKGVVIHGDGLWPEKTYGMWMINPDLRYTQGAPHIMAIPKEDWLAFRLGKVERKPNGDVDQVLAHPVEVAKHKHPEVSKPGMGAQLSIF